MTPERLAELARRYGSLTLDAYAHDHPATHAAELLAEVDRLNQRVADGSQFPANGDGQRFEAGKTYRTTNGLQTFKCDYIAAGFALGIERHMRPGANYRRTWYAVMAEGCWTEVDAEESAR